MAAKKDLNSSLPLTQEADTTPSAKITYANEVVAIIAGLAANEVEGIAGMCSVSGNILNNRGIRDADPARLHGCAGECPQGHRIHDRAACGPGGRPCPGRQL